MSGYMVKQKSALNNRVCKTRRVYVRMYFATTQTNITATTRMSTSYFLHLYLSCKRHRRSSSESTFAQHRFRPPSRHSPDSIIATIHFYCVAIKRENCRLASIGFVDRVTSSGVTVGRPRWPKTPLMPSLQVDS